MSDVNKVLVTGGGGFLGAVLAKLLVAVGYQVVVLDQMIFGSEPLRSLVGSPQLTLVQAELSSAAARRAALDGVCAVVHLAAVSNDPSCDLDPTHARHTNTSLTARLAEEAAERGVGRFLFASSCSVYSGNESLVDEATTPAGDLSLYAKTKLEAEEAVQRIAAATGMEACSLRLATLWGVSPRMRLDLSMNRMTLDAVTTGCITVSGTGNQWRPLLHVRDAAVAVAAALAADRLPGVLNIGTGDRNLRMGDAAQWVAAAVMQWRPGVPVEVVTSGGPVAQRSYRVSFAAAREYLGLPQPTTFAPAVMEVADWIADNAGQPGWDQTSYDTAAQLSLLLTKPAVAGGRPLREEFLPFSLPMLGEEEELEVLDTLRSGWLTTGPKVTRFEAALKDLTGARHAVAVSSCTAALHLALAGLGVGRGDEVLVPAVTYPATANVVVHLGATPVLVDVDPTTLNIDINALSAAISPRTKAIVPVHMAGQPVDMASVWDLAERYGIPVVEDAAHAIGATYDGIPVGGLPRSKAAAFSFYPIKNITTIEGGALLTNDDELAETARILALHGVSKNAWKRYGSGQFVHWDTLLPGYKYNMSDVQAAVGLPQLKRLAGFLDTRRRYAECYTAALLDVPELELLRRVKGVQHAWHLFIVLLRPDRLTIDRDGFVEALRQEGIGTGIHFRSLHVQPYYRLREGVDPSRLTNASDVTGRLLSLPLYPKMTDRDVTDVIRAVRKVVSYYRVMDVEPDLIHLDVGSPFGSLDALSDASTVTVGANALAKGLSV